MKSGVLKYKCAKCEIRVYFPDGLENCANCEFCQVERYRARCLLRRSAIIPLEYLGTKPDECPLDFAEEIND
jgi:hypothetical protein